MAPETAQSEALAEAWALLQRVMFGQRARMFTIAAEFDLAPAQLMALASLEPDEPRPMSGLAQTLRCDNSNVTGIVDRLEARGLVARRPGERDRRVKFLVVTPEGVELRDRVRARLGAPPDALAALDEQDAVALRDILRRAVSSTDT
jgi:MarR family transcriptional regulator, organic hydroperoxide resistance regulator